MYKLQFLITPYDSIEDYYIDQRLNKKIFVNHREHKIINIEDFTIDLDPHVNKYRYDLSIYQIIKCFFIL